MKKIILCLSIAFLSVINCYAYFKVGDLYYEVAVNNDEVQVVRGPSTYNKYYVGKQSLVVPASITYQGKTYKVTEIVDLAFADCPDLEKIEIGENIKKIGSSSSIHLCYGSPKVNHIIWRAKQCKGWDYYYSPFYYQNNNNAGGCTQITTLEFSDEVEMIPDYLCLGMTNLQTVSIGKNVTSIGVSNSQYFKNIYITDLASYCNISISGTFPKHQLFLNNVELTSLAVPDNISSISENTFRNCISISSLVTNNVTTIASNAFNGCDNLSSIVIEETISNIGENAFSGCPIKNVGYHAIDCADLSQQLFDDWSVVNITIGDQVKHIPANLCNYQSLESITIPENIESIGDNAFTNCKHLKNIVWNAKNCEVASSVFSLNALLIDSIQSFVFGRYVQVIPNYICAYMQNITEIDIPESVKVISRRAFYGCTSLTDVNINGNELKIIGNDAFCYCENLTTINLPSSLTDIGSTAFSGCSAWRVVLPDSLVHIGENAFYNTFSYNQNRSWNDGVFYIDNYLIRAKNLENEYAVQDGTILIADGAFSESYGLTSVTLPQSIKYIGHRAFYNCTKMETNIELPNNLVFVGDSAMYFQSNIKQSFAYSLILPRSLSYIGKYAFCDEKAEINAIYAFMHTPPMIDSWTFNLQNSMANTPVYVYADDINEYLKAEVWKQFDIQSFSVPVVDVNDSIYLDISRTEVTFSWQKINQANLYELAVLLANGDTLEIVKINGSGEIMSDDRKLVKSTASASHGYQYTISGLENNTTYAYFLIAQSSVGNTLKEYSGTFVTGQRYTVKFVDWDDSLLKEEIVRESESATPPEDPVREGYTFTGWDKSYTDIRNNTIIKATYSLNTVYYTVTFLDWDGTELYVEQVEEGHDAIGPAEEPTREGYTFIGWSKPLTNIQSNLIVVAQYQENTEDVENVINNNALTQKIVVNGQILILRGDKTYTLTGQQIR